VSTYLMLEVMDDAPDWLTWRERYVLMAMADNFNDATRIGWPAFEGKDERSEKFRRRARCTRRQFYETLAELINKGVLIVEVPGHNGRQAVYRIPRLATARPLPPEKRKVSKPRKQKAPEAVGDTNLEGFPEPYANPHGVVTEPELGAGNPHPSGDVGCGNDGSRVRENRTPIPQVSSTLKELKTLSSENVEPTAVPAVAAAVADESKRSPDPSGLPAGHGAKAAPREREIHQGTIDELDTLTLRLTEEEERRREKTVVESAVISLRHTHGIDEAGTLIGLALVAIELADKQAHGEAREAAANAIRPPQWQNPARANRYRQELDMHAVIRALNRRPLRDWPVAVLEPLGLAVHGAAAA
jgi:hypothetical protein